MLGGAIHLAFNAANVAGSVAPIQNSVAGIPACPYSLKSSDPIICGYGTTLASPIVCDNTFATRARRDDVSSDLAFVRVRGTKRKTRDRIVPIVTDDQRSLLKYALEHAQGENGLLFLYWQNVRRDLRAACAKLKIPRCSPNDLRRTCATWLRAAGTPPHLIAPVMGHADSRMVERVYGRLEPAALAQLIAKATGSSSAGSQQTGTDRLAFGGPDGQQAARKCAKLAPH